MLETTRTHKAKITNHEEVRDDLDVCGFAASKLWNVARYYVDERWKQTGKIPSDGELKRELKHHERYADLHSQSSQRILEELVEAFRSWFEQRRRGDGLANPPGYRKRGNDHPRSTITWKNKGIKHDVDKQRIRLSKGANVKRNRSDFIFAFYETRPDVVVENIQQVRAVWKSNRWELHIVCNTELSVDSPPGEATAGVDLGISNFLAIAYENARPELYPGNALKEDKHYFTRLEYGTSGSGGPSKRAIRYREMLSRRREHFLHTLSKHIVNQCIENGVSYLAIGDLSRVTKNTDGTPRDWGRHGNKKLHGWAYGKFTRLLEYKAEERGIIVDRVDERGTSKTCSSCGRIRTANRVERGLYVCDRCGIVLNADVNGAENIRKTLTQSPQPGDMSNGRLARPAILLFHRTAGQFVPQKQIDCESVCSGEQ